MEEIKKKKKLNKKPLLICLAIALVFAVIGFIDIKSNAAESLYTARVYCLVSQTFQGTTTEDITVNNTVTSNSPIYVYAHNYTEPITGDFSYRAHVISKSPISGTPNANLTFTDSDGVTWYYCRDFSSGGRTSATINYSTWYAEGVDTLCVINGSLLTPEEFMIAFKNGTLDYTQDIDFDSFEVDDDMPVPTNIKRNIIKNEIKDSLIPDTLGGETYDYITWTNTSETYPLQLQVGPVVQYFDVRLTENIFTKEFYGEWNTQAIYEEVTNSFTLCTFTTNPDTLLKYPLFSTGLSFKSECNDKYSKGIFEENYLKFGYRIRYVDIENEKASPWLVLVPTKELDDYKTFVEYADATISDSSDGNGLFNEYENLDDIENAKTDIKTENEFKDKYEIVDGDVDTQEATNWLYSVVNFIKGTPQVVGSVLGFLPQPILYGMYVCIFLGVIASGLAIVKALL